MVSFRHWMQVHSNNGRILCQLILIPRGFIVVLTEVQELGRSLVNQGWMCHARLLILSFWILLIIGLRPVVCWVGLSCVSKSTAISLNVATELLKYWLWLPRSSRASPREDAINMNSNLRLRTAIQNKGKLSDFVYKSTANWRMFSPLRFGPSPKQMQAVLGLHTTAPHDSRRLRLKCLVYSPVYTGNCTHCSSPSLFVDFCQRVIR